MNLPVKKLVLLLILMGSIATPVAVFADPPAEERTVISAEEAVFAKEAKLLHISHRKETSLKGIANGYYLIAGVFGNSDNATKFAKRLKNKGLSAKMLTNPQNQMQYVYLGHYDQGIAALDVYKNNIKPRYTDKIWVLQVQNTLPKSTEIKQEEAASPIKAMPEPEAYSFAKMAKASNIATRSLDSSADLKAGYYLISGVFGQESNANRFAAKLAGRFASTGSLQHPETKLFHVYLNRFDQGMAAIEAFNSKLQGRYQDKMWILEVKFPEQVDLHMEGSSESLVAKQATHSRSRSNLSKGASLNNDKLMDKADLYFDKMWYAEAAEIYE
ncbi:MAG: SPOR domain-containing protein, partial [Eudoraea sp.]|nr:SPOR domain-containing protein [Eudoraea sp.]NNJ40508.1 SPOR domain-containing protein [Eudoraea sp.]